VGRACRGTKKTSNTLHTIILVTVEPVDASVDERVSNIGTLFWEVHGILFAHQVTTCSCKTLNKKRNVKSLRET
jgi:hypothetical protein